MRGWLIAAGLVLMGSSASAQHAASGTLADLGFKVAKPMSDKDVASTRAKVDASIAKAADASLLENVTDAYGGKVRHRASGLVCPLGKKGQRIVAATGNSAECEVVSDGAIYRTNIVRAPVGATLDSVEAAVRAAVEREPHYAPISGAQVVGHPNPGSGRPDHRTLRFVSKVDGHDRASRLQVGLVHGWVLTERQEYPGPAVPPMGMGDLLQEAMFGTNVK